MGLGELLAGLFGGNAGEQEAVRRTGAISGATSAFYKAVESFTGKKLPKEKADKIKNFYTDAIEMLMKPTPLGASNEVTKLVQGDEETLAEGAEEAAEALMAVITGRTAELQLEDIIGAKIDSSMPFTSRLTGNMGVVTDITLASSLSSIIAEIASVGQIDQIGGELRAYLDYSGLSQITGYGYGMILSTAITPPIQQEINSKTLNTILQPDLLVLLRRRELIDEGYYRQEMAKHGLSDTASDNMSKAYEFYPSGQDFISFAVRDAFNPEIVARAGLDENFPTDIVPYAQKAGMDEEVLKWYWRSHWQLPSPQMGYEMLHRGIISGDVLKSLLRASDWAPGWIDELMEISYNPLTRVDARRMWETDVLTDDEFFKAMKDLGYNDVNAGRYLTWVKAQQTGGGKDLTKAVVINAYNLGVIERSDTLTYLESFGYDGDEADLLLSIEDRKLEQKTIQDSIKVAQWEYARYVLTEKGFIRRLSELDIPTSKAKLYLIKAEQDRVKRAKLPAKEDIMKWLKADLITADEAGNYLTRLGYRAKERDLYLRSWTE